MPPRLTACVATFPLGQDISDLALQIIVARLENELRRPGVAITISGEMLEIMFLVDDAKEEVLRYRARSLLRRALVHADHQGLLGQPHIEFRRIDAADLQ